jgi:hypothetical protein
MIFRRQFGTTTFAKTNPHPDKFLGEQERIRPERPLRTSIGAVHKTGGWSQQ